MLRSNLPSLVFHLRKGPFILPRDLAFLCTISIRSFATNELDSTHEDRIILSIFLPL